MTARIPVFVSAPSALSPGQTLSYESIVAALADEDLEARALGRSDYGIDFPLREVFSIASHCAGGLILGFGQAFASEVVSKPGTAAEAVLHDQRFPSAWNNLEAGILFALRRPLMIFREDGVHGGVFDHGASEVFVQRLPSEHPTPEESLVIKSVVKTWGSKVRQSYREY